MRFSFALLFFVILASASAQEATAIDQAKLLYEVQQLHKNDYPRDRDPSAEVEKEVIFQEAVEPDDSMEAVLEWILVPKKRYPETRQKVWEQSPAVNARKENINKENAPGKKNEPKGDRTPTSDVHKIDDTPEQKKMHQERTPLTDLKKPLSVPKLDHYVRVRNPTQVQKSVVHLIQPPNNESPDVVSPKASIRTS